ncbi:MAG: UbiA-like polyprenyltransferase, partial [Gemmatimonadota bacterium]
GRLTLAQAWAAVLAASVVFVVAAWQLNPLCGMLAPVALAWVFFYSFTKRFTAWSHHVLGLALGIAPVGAYLALAGEWSEPWYALVALAAAVMGWVAGFDVIYSIQDVDFDREHGLHSLPARLGVPRALRLARGFHFASVVLFFLPWAFGWFDVGWLYLAGVVGMAAILHYEYTLVRGREAHELELDRIDRAFFRANVGVSTLFFAFVLLDRVLLR